MRAHYDFSKMKGRRNPYVRFLKQSVTIRLDREIVDYFKALAVKAGVPYQHLINLYLRDCVARRKELTMLWAVRGGRASKVAEGRRPYGSSKRK